MLNVYNLVVFVHRQLDEFTYIFRCIGVDLQMYMLNCVIIFCRFKWQLFSEAVECGRGQSRLWVRCLLTARNCAVLIV